MRSCGARAAESSAGRSSKPRATERSPGKNMNESAVIPILETPRLIMRGHRSSDFESVAAMWGDFEVAKHISGKPSTKEESWARMLRYAGLWHFLGYGYWVLEDK